jgi:hypothetical protein
MARLDAMERNALPDSAFAGAGRTYPVQVRKGGKLVDDPGHAKSALAYAAKNNPPDKARIDARAKAILRRKKQQ